MKTSFKPTRGHNHHVVHETKTALAGGTSCWTLCGEFFPRGERGNRATTCPSCAKLDNPLTLSPALRMGIAMACDVDRGTGLIRSTLEMLVTRDYVDQNMRLTRRGRVLADDWALGVVPLADSSGLMHMRKPLNGSPVCNVVTMDLVTSTAIGNSVTLDGVDDMSTSRYERLRGLLETTVVSCLSCLGR